MNKKIILDAAVKVPGKESIKEVVMREPKLKDMRVVDRTDGGDLDKEAMMISRLTGINIEDLDEFPAAQYKQLQEKYASFFVSTGQKQDDSA